MLPTSLPVHGATDSGPEPDLDFSSNAHPLGPCPAVLAAMGRHDPTRYPDPSYAELRRRLAGVHGVHPDQVVVGAGAAELVHRIVRAGGGTVRHQLPGFGEYAHAAACAGLPCGPFPSEGTPEAGPGTVFLCLPNNPDGSCPDSPTLAALAQGCHSGGATLVLDLAYLPFLESPPALPISAIHLHAPNKAFGLVGVRAAYALAPDPESGRRLAAAAPSWVLGAQGVAFLEACVGEAALGWLAETSPTARDLRAALASLLRGHGFRVRESSATHLVARHEALEGSGALAAALRQKGVRVRDTSSMGLPGWVRLAARPRHEIARLGEILQDILP